MGKRKVSILESADAFKFFDKLSGENVLYKPCRYPKWLILKYRCVTYKKKYIVAYLSQEKEIIICDFVSSKLLK